MSKWCVVVVATLIACSKKGDCPAAKKAAIASIDDKLSTISDRLKLAKEHAAGSDPKRVDSVRSKFDVAVKSVEGNLDCAFLSKASAPELVMVQQALGDLVDVASEVPEATATAIKPVAELFEANLGLLSGPNKGIGEWCKSMRDTVAKMKTDVIPGWEAAKADVQSRRDVIDKELGELRAKDATLREVREAVQQTKSVTPDTTEEGRVRDALTAYQGACH